VHTPALLRLYDRIQAIPVEHNAMATGGFSRFWELLFSKMPEPDDSTALVVEFALEQLDDAAVSLLLAELDGAYSSAGLVEVEEADPAQYAAADDAAANAAAAKEAATANDAATKEAAAKEAATADAAAKEAAANNEATTNEAAASDEAAKEVATAIDPAAKEAATDEAAMKEAAADEATANEAAAKEAAAKEAAAKEAAANVAAANKAAADEVASQKEASKPLVNPSAGSKTKVPAGAAVMQRKTEIAASLERQLPDADSTRLCFSDVAKYAYISEVTPNGDASAFCRWAAQSVHWLP
jgi:hypothetical protein